jgi:hypothetical protein
MGMRDTGELAELYTGQTPDKSFDAFLNDPWPQAR